MRDMNKALTVNKIRGRVIHTQEVKSLLRNNEAVIRTVSGLDVLNAPLGSGKIRGDISSLTKYNKDGSSDWNVKYLFNEVNQKLSCPIGHIGSKFWVREYWYWEGETGWTDIQRIGNFWYKADAPSGFAPFWKAPQHMPPEAARIFLQISDTTVKRVQDIAPRERAILACTEDEKKNNCFFWEIRCKVLTTNGVL